MFVLKPQLSLAHTKHGALSGTMAYAVIENEKLVKKDDLGKQLLKVKTNNCFPAPPMNGIV